MVYIFIQSQYTDYQYNTTTLNSFEITSFQVKYLYYRQISRNEKNYAFFSDIISKFVIL
jgi:hypothetical protein